jgi:hypothetical protein
VGEPELRMVRIRPNCAGLITLIELSLGLGLLVPRLAHWSALCGIAVLAVFTISTAVAILTRQVGKDCGCMIPGMNGAIGWHTCLRNISLALLLIRVLAQGWLTGSSEPLGLILLGVSVYTAKSEPAPMPERIKLGANQTARVRN